ncbi:murein hydrolase activator EnvC family protein [Aromatoleum buckelii]|nr:peptidoglycan DD-metalloendopeptidase family protein [Aromatoleum buckelii]MCK0512161.1 peptidoglycan DD-metalloendopeptidase family protein [Aromatoleum buckelii]
MTVLLGLRSLVPALAVALLLGAPAARASEPAEVVQKRSDLEEVKRRIADLRKEIADTEETRSGAAAELAAAERAVSQAQRRLHALAAERATTEKSLAILEAEQDAVEARIAGRQAELGEWLRRHYIHGAGGGVAPFLSTRDANQFARDAHYLEHLGRARLALIESLRGDLRQKAELGESIAGRRDHLVALEAQQRTQHATLESMQGRRKQALDGISRQLLSQRKEEETLHQDQQRLGRLVEVLARRAAEREAARAAAAAAAREAAARAAARAAAEKRADAAGAARTTPRSRSEAVVGEVRQAAEATPTGVSFAQLRGKMRFPVRGELVGRFGAPRAEGGTTWRGVFIRASGGAEVRAVAAGEIVFSDWLRGYGNLIIVDHGSDYLSIYGNNDALLKELGDVIAGGDPIASVGASGGASESGLYFEIRYRGQPVDPLQWVRLN